MRHYYFLSLFALFLVTGLTACGVKDSTQVVKPQIITKEVKVEIPVKCKVKLPERPELNLDKRSEQEPINVKGNSVIVDRRNLLDYSQKLEVILKECTQSVN